MATKSNASERRSAGKDAPTTKRNRLVRLLKAGAGRDIARLSRELGWLPHTTRAALTRLRKDGYAIEKLPPLNGGGSRYRITGEPTEPTS